MTAARHLAIVGAGWAGLAAAITATQAGHQVTLIEAARQVGGRARTLVAQRADGRPIHLDNGQHILIGAYSECLRLMRCVGVDPDTALLRQPLALTFPDGSGLRLPDLAPPWDAMLGIARARGWTLTERAALLARAARWRRQQFLCPPSTSVAELCAGLPARLLEGFITPLCISALNTPPEAASGQVFLRVLHDSLFAGHGGSHLLLPRVDLGALFPEPAARWLQAQGQTLRLGQRVQSLAQTQTGWQLDGEAFDAVLLACPASEAARLVPSAASAVLQAWAHRAAALHFAAIATVYLELPSAHGPLLAQPMLTLPAAAQQPAQFVFDHAHLQGQAGVLAFVVSAFEGDRARLQAQVLAQAQTQLGLQGLQPLQTVVEKRATFVCSPALQRPPMQIAPGLLACADYVQGSYPATLEGAVRLGVAAARHYLHSG